MFCGKSGKLETKKNENKVSSPCVIAFEIFSQFNEFSGKRKSIHI